jgi:ABC-type glutathione transport system ATPase component
MAYVAGRSAGAARWPTRHDASGSSLIGMDATVVRTDRLTKRYGERLAVHSVSLTVGRGEVYGFPGPDGAGKTTTLRMLLGLVRPPAAGTTARQADPMSTGPPRSPIEDRLHRRGAPAADAPEPDVREGTTCHRTRPPPAHRAGATPLIT